jgi:hypothetical protein
MQYLTIKRHCVNNHPDTKLSTLQHVLLHDEHPVRIASAPTGAGKSYAFQRAMIDKGERILFIIPTRRLAQNLMRSLREDLKKADWNDDKIKNKTRLWSSDASQDLYDQGLKGIIPRRLRDIHQLDDSRAGGEMIIAIAETVSQLLLRPALQGGLAADGIFDFLDSFNHIVFDEFHTIEARGFGLAAVFAKLAADGFGHAKISFLSATPLDIRTVLEKISTPAEQIVELQEPIDESPDSRGRAIHGDVKLSIQDSPSMVNLLQQHQDIIRENIKDGRQVVVIYNKLIDLQNQRPELENFMFTLGLTPQDGLLINSIDDSREEITNAGDFAVGRKHQPEHFKLLIATASVEMGVTFKTNLLFMESGFEPLNFLQRYGRAARGDERGTVIVRSDSGLLNRLSWFRKLDTWVNKGVGKTLSIIDLSAKLIKLSQKESIKNKSDNPKNYGELSNRAIYMTGLYWMALEKHPSNDRRARAEHLRKHAPRQVGLIAGKLKAVRQLCKDPYYQEAAQNWCDRFEAECRRLRDIGRKVNIVENAGKPFSAGVYWLQNNAPSVFKEGQLRIDDEGKITLHINRELRSFIADLDERQYIPEEIDVLFPHTQMVERLPLKDCINNWCRIFTDNGSPAQNDAWRKHKSALKAAESLTRCTGIIVSNEIEIEMDTQVLVM